jgi:hypothetical protein
MAVKIFFGLDHYWGRYNCSAQSETKQNLIPLSLRLSSIEFSICSLRLSGIHTYSETKWSKFSLHLYYRIPLSLRLSEI